MQPLQLNPAKFCYALSALVISLSLAAPTEATVQMAAATVAVSQSAQSKLPIYVWRDKSKKLRSIVVTIHGATQQALSFDRLARKLAEKGYLVCSMDLRGHGRWHLHKSKKEDGYNVDYKESVKDLTKLVQVLQNKRPDLPIFCVGESCGAAVAVDAAKECPQIKGMILASVGTHPVLHRYQWVLPDTLKGLANLSHPMRIMRYVARYSSDDPRVSDEMNEDPLGRHTMSGKEILATGLFIRRTPEKAKKLSQDLPMLVIQGTDDNICSPTSVKSIVRKVPAFDKQLVFLKHCGHVLLGTKFIKPEVSKLVMDWLAHHSDMALAAKSPIALRRVADRSVSPQAIQVAQSKIEVTN
jgi:alpha-beta hydrolase superfamily lysophospholipase